MRLTLQRELRRLRDVAGVYGSFLVDPFGVVVGRDVSPLVGPLALQEAGAALGRFWFSVDKAVGEELVLEFASHRLFSLRLREGSLCVLIGTVTNLLELRAHCVSLRERIERR